MQQSSTFESLTFGLGGERVRRGDHGGGEEDREEKGGDVEAHDDYRRLRRRGRRVVIWIIGLEGRSGEASLPGPELRNLASLYVPRRAFTPGGPTWIPEGYTRARAYAMSAQRFSS